MSSFLAIFKNPALIAAFFGWLSAQLLKVPIGYYVTKKWKWRRALNSGGMPSSHTASVVAAAVTIGYFQGFDSATFASIAILAIIVMYDATGVRRAAGKHAKVLNELIQLFKGETELTDEKLKEWIGHTPIEVFVGAWLGILVGVIVINVILISNRIA